MRKNIAIAAIILALCALIIPAAASSPPEAQSFEFCCRSGAELRDRLAATDSDGGDLRFVTATKPRKGKLKLNSDGSFIYTPAEDWHGRDYFGYRAIDPQGNVSQEATVIIRVEKCEP